MRFPIGLKLIVGFSVVVIMLIVVAVVGLNGFDRVQSTYETQVRRIDATLRFAERIEGRVAAEIGAVAGYLLIGDPRYRDDFERAKADIDETIGEMRDIMWDAEAIRRVDGLAWAIEQHAAVARPIFERQDYTREEASALVSTGLRDVREQLLQALQEVVNYQTMRVQHVTDQASMDIARSRLLVIIIAVGAVVAGLVVSVVMQRGIAGPVRQTTEAALRLADGDLRVKELDVRTRDEMADMAGAFNRMTANLRTMMEQIREMSKVLLDNGQSLLAVADESAGATGQIAEAIHDVAQGTNRQVVQVHETRAALDEIVDAIRLTDELAREISEAAAEMASASPEMLNSMTEMAAVTEENTAATQQMAASSEQVVRSMDEVAAVSEEAASAAEEVSTSTEEVNAAVEDMRSSVHVLRDIASNLDEVVGRFRL